MDSDLNIIGKEIFFARTVGSRLSKGTLIVVVPNLFVSISATHLSPPGDLSKKNSLKPKFRIYMRLQILKFDLYLQFLIQNLDNWINLEQVKILEICN